MCDMKISILFSILFLGFGFNSFSQQTVQSALVSGGGDFTSAIGENIQFTIGQPYSAATLTDANNYSLTQGFQQPSFKGQDVLFPDLALVSKMDVYPNPAVDYTDLELNFINNDGAKVAIVDMWGQVVKTQDFNVDKGQQKLRFSFGSLSAGVYTIKVIANKTIYAKKLLINTSGNASNL